MSIVCYKKKAKKIQDLFIKMQIYFFAGENFTKYKVATIRYQYQIEGADLQRITNAI